MEELTRRLNDLLDRWDREVKEWELLASDNREDPAVSNRQKARACEIARCRDMLKHAMKEPQEDDNKPTT